jgi:sulfonate transport system substrate-binding protein
MTRQVKVLIVLLGVVLIVSFVAYRQDLFERSVNTPMTGDPTDFSSQSPYSNYKFGNDDNVFDIGGQPLTPHGVIYAVMKRDTILRSTLAMHGIEIRFHSFLKGVDMKGFIENGQLEAGIAGDLPVLVACANHGVSVASLMNHSYVSIIAREEMMIPDLEGKRIGFARGTNAHFVLMEALGSEGLGPDDVKLIPLQVFGMPEALYQGVIDAFAAWEPTPTISLKKYPDFVAIHRGLSTGYLYFSQSLTERAPDVIKEVVASQLRAMAWINADTNNLRMASRWTLKSAQEIGSTADVTVEGLYSVAVNEGLPNLPPSAFLFEKDFLQNGALFREFKFAQQLGMIPGGTRWQDIVSCFDLELVPEISLQNQRYQLNAGDFIKDFSESEENEQTRPQ